MEINELAFEINQMGSIISVNEVYQESINFYENYNNELQGLKYKEGELSQIKKIEDNIVVEDEKLVTNFKEATEKLNEYREKIEEYRDFIFKITNKIYAHDVKSYFGIKIRKKHLKTRPIVFELSLKGETGEGVGEVKKNLIDFLTYKYNTYSEILIMDSACFSGIDPRQVVGMLNEVNDIAMETKKQAIISINKYQIIDSKNSINFVENNSVLSLSENDKLLKEDF